MKLFQLTKRDGSNLGQPMTGEKINETLLAALEEIEQLKNPWISVEDRLPDDELDFDLFLVSCLGEVDKGFSRYEQRVARYNSEDKNFLHVDDYEPLFKVDKWMPIPKLEG